MARLLRLALAMLAVLGLALVACAPAAPPPAPTAAPAAPKAAEPTKAPAAPAPTKAPEPTRAPEPTKAPTAAPKVSWPEKGKAITILIPYAAGGTADIVTRLIAPLLEKQLGVPLTLVNRAGATGQVAYTELAKAKPDGYTLATANFMPILVTYLDPERQAVYTRKDFQPVAHFVTGPNALYARSESPYKTAKDLVDAAKAQPEKVSVAHSGILSNSHIALLMLEQLTGARFGYVQFDGSGPCVTALLGGHVDTTSIGVASMVSHIKAGTVRALGVWEKQEIDMLPGVKTMEAQGYPVYAPVTHGIIAPAGTPREIVSTLAKAIEVAAKDKELQKKFEETAQTVDYRDAAGFEAYWADMEARLKPVVEAAKKR